MQATNPRSSATTGDNGSISSLNSSANSGPVAPKNGMDDVLDFFACSNHFPNYNGGAESSGGTPSPSLPTASDFGARNSKLRSALIIDEIYRCEELSKNILARLVSAVFPLSATNGSLGKN